jgi:hypothetical protein
MAYCMGSLFPLATLQMEETIPQPFQDLATLFEELLQDLPPETAQMAREFKDFTRSRKIKTPVQLLRVVLLYCGLDKSLRELAGHLPAGAPILAPPNARCQPRPKAGA